MPDYYKQRPLLISRTDLLKAISYLNDAARLYEALPMQSLRNRAYVIRQLTEKLNKKIKDNNEPK